MPSPDQLDPQHLDLAALNRSLTGTRFAGRLHHFATIDSTNTQLLTAASTGAPEGTVYLADSQTAGRGRSNHAWHSAPGLSGRPVGLYLSALVKPALRLRDALLLSLATGLAASQAIHQTTTLTPDIRWPNDLLLQDKKLGGILVETAVEPGPDPLLRHAVIGIGINLHQTSFPPDLAPLATSLHLADSQPVSRAALVLAFLRALDLELTDLELTQLEADSTADSLRQRFTAASTWANGKRVNVPEQGGYTGSTVGLDERGFLLVRSDDGTLHTVLSGGVRELNS